MLKAAIEDHVVSRVDDQVDQVKNRQCNHLHGLVPNGLESVVELNHGHCYVRDGDLAVKG